MGKRGSDLCKFIKKGLKKKYINLKRISNTPLTFSLYLPRKTTKLDPAYEQFLKDWRQYKHKSYKYSMAKQAVETALKKSDFFKKMPSTKPNELIYQILDEDEILEKKKSKSVKVKEEYRNPLSVESSGYGSSGDIGNSFTSSDEEMECKMEDVHIPYEPFGIQNIEDPYLGNAVPYLFNDLDTSFENELVSIDPNEIMIDERNGIWQHFEKMYKGEIGESEEEKGESVGEKRESEGEKESTSENNDQCPMDSVKDPYYLQHAFSEMDLNSFEGDGVDLNELMNLDIEDFIKVEKKPEVMKMYYLKEVRRTDGGEVLIFSPNAFEEMKGLKNEPGVNDESRVAVDNEIKETISTAICSPLSIGLVNGEIHLCLKR